MSDSPTERDSQRSVMQWDGETAMVSKANQARQFFEAPQKYLERNFNIRARAYIVRKLLGDVTNKNILDIGCGDGSISRQFLSDSNRLTLLDLSTSMLEVAQSKTPQEYLHQTSYINNDFNKCGFVNEFDLVLCVGVLAHVDSVAETVQAISTSLKNGGMCLLQITDADSLFSRAMKAYGVLRRAKAVKFGYAMNRTTSSMVLELAAQNSLEFLKQSRYSLLLPGMLRLPDGFLYRYQIATVESKWFSGFGTEALSLFRKR
jgi:2-polyprenyl-3-methyl-5-hydroxy-6-metoxy-1,4-benzoquinol methylase